MKRVLDNRIWLLLVGLAIALTIACSSGDDSSGKDSGSEPAADAQTAG